MDQLTLAKIMMKVNELPVFSQITSRIIEIINDPKTTTDQICDVIGQDQVIVTKALKIVNSAYYGLPRKIATIKEAVTMLGTDTLRTLVIGASVYTTLEHLSGGKKQVVESMWRHAAACAAASRIIALRIGIHDQEHAFVAGLLHDIGKSLLLFVKPKEYYNVITSTESGFNLIETEQELLGLTHTQVGKIAAEKWNLPPLLVSVIGDHHDDNQQDSQLLTVVRIADSVSNLAGYSFGGSNNITISTDLLTDCGLTYEDLCRISDELRGKISIDFL